MTQSQNMFQNLLQRNFEYYRELLAQILIICEWEQAQRILHVSLYQ